MGYEEAQTDDYVMNVGEYAKTFYIILRGRVSVRIQSKVEKQFEFRELLTLLLENKRWIVRNEDFDKATNYIQSMIPELIKVDAKGSLHIKYDMMAKVLNDEIILESQKKYESLFPSFEYLKDNLDELQDNDRPP